MIVAILRKPLTGTIIQTLTEFGGGMNIDASRVDYEIGGDSASNPMLRKARGCRMLAGAGTGFWGGASGQPEIGNSLGRFPANILHTGDSVLRAFPDAIGATSGSGFTGLVMSRKGHETAPRGDAGSASRFFKQVRL